MIKSPLPNTLQTGILHLGLGAFHRAHQAVYTQDAMIAEEGAWGIEAVAMRSPKLAGILSKQGNRFTLIERGSDGNAFHEITSIKKVHFLPDATHQVALRFAAQYIHIITLTVTEKGYHADLSKRCLNFDDVAIKHDLEQSPQAPKSLIGLIVQGLSLRRDAGGTGLTLMSCDNLPSNGQFLKTLVLAFAEAKDKILATWIETHCCFPDSMVDRITPAATAETIELLKNAGEPMDLAAIETEPFKQWVIEDNFAGPRPAWEKAGALLVSDVAPYEMMKLRLLNGSHSLIAYLGALAGMQYVRDAMANATIRALTRRHMQNATNTLAPMHGFDFNLYAEALVERFENRAIDHRCIQIAMDGSQKLSQRIFAPAAECVASGQPIDTFAFAIAAWIQFAGGLDDHNRPLELSDPLASAIRNALGAHKDSASSQIQALAKIDGFAHQDMLDHPNFARHVATHLDAIRGLGALAAAKALLDQLDSENSVSGHTP